MHSSKDLWLGMHGCIGPFFFPEMKSRRFENTVEATRGYCLLRIPQLWAVRFMRPAARTDTISEIKIDTLYMSYRKESIDIDIKSILFQEKIC
jgi:hypothetical protein